MTVEVTEASDIRVPSPTSSADRRLLLTEICRDIALCELRNNFERLWLSIFERKGLSWFSLVFNDWYVEALNVSSPDWLPLPGPLVGSEDAEIVATKSPALIGWSTLWRPDGGDGAQRVPTPQKSEDDPVAIDIGLKIGRLCSGMVAALDVLRQRWKPKCDQLVSSARAMDDVYVELRELGCANGAVNGHPHIRLELHGTLPSDTVGLLPLHYDITNARADKLRNQFEKRGVHEGESFEAACWALLSRYHAMFGPEDIGAGAHMACCPEVFQNLDADFGVTCELFASPLNHYFPTFCSLFPDTDRRFGSFGSFFQFCATDMRKGGSFECNAPFEEFFMKRVVGVLEDALDTATEPLAVTLIMPEWQESAAIRSARKSRFCEGSLCIVGESHAYLSGTQHCCQEVNRVVRQTRGRGTFVVFLQNAAARARWPITDVTLGRQQLAWTQGAAQGLVHKVPVEDEADLDAVPDEHRLHYRWSQLEGDRCGGNIGTCSRPLPSPDRIMHLNPEGEYRPRRAKPEKDEAQFACFKEKYRNINYNTFYENPLLRLTEVEVYFLSSKMTRESCSKWVVIYLGIGNGEHVRKWRDYFFPGLVLLGFDYFPKPKPMCEIEKTIGHIEPDTDTTVLHERPFDLISDSAWIKERFQDKGLLVISNNQGETVHIRNDAQLAVIQSVSPTSSMVRFKPPSGSQHYCYVPGTAIKMICQAYGETELRLIFDGVPKRDRWYSRTELFEKMYFHHECLRGQVHDPGPAGGRMACLDSCFDCSVLWSTCTSYAQRNGVAASDVLRYLVKENVHAPSPGGYIPFDYCPSWTVEDVAFALAKGRLTEAIAALELDVDGDLGCMDLMDIVPHIEKYQPQLAERMKSELKRPLGATALIRFIGTLSEPFTFLWSFWNTPGSEDSIPFSWKPSPSGNALLGTASPTLGTMGNGQGTEERLGGNYRPEEPQLIVEEPQMKKHCPEKCAVDAPCDREPQ